MGAGVTLPCGNNGWIPACAGMMFFSGNDGWVWE